MLKEQLFSFAMKAYSQVYEVKERLKNSIKNESVESYVQSLSDAAIKIIESQWRKLGRSEHNAKASKTAGKKSYSFGERDESGRTLRKNLKVEVKKMRKSSIKPAKEIGSLRADIILQQLKKSNFRMVTHNDALDGKKSLAYLVWALGHAEQAALNDGISVHDVSALLYRACKIELYPINISRVVYGNPALVRQVGQEKRTKTYLLTSEGEALFKKNFV